MTSIHDVTGALGFSRKQSEEILAEVRANLAKLDGCAGPHAFESMNDRPIAPRYRCTKCGGCVDSDRRRWYELGLTHAVRNK